MFITLNKKGQSTLEYALIIAVVVAALVAMQVYIKRGMQGKLRSAADDIGEQFSPGYTNSTKAVTTTVNSTETVVGGNAPVTSVGRTQGQDRTVNESVAGADSEYWVK